MRICLQKIFYLERTLLLPLEEGFIHLSEAPNWHINIRRANVRPLSQRQRLADELYARELAVTGGRLSSRRGKKEQPQNLDEDELREATFYRLEALGYRVGLGIVERYVLGESFSMCPYQEPLRMA